MGSSQRRPREFQSGRDRLTGCGDPGAQWLCIRRDRWINFEFKAPVPVSRALPTVALLDHPLPKARVEAGCNLFPDRIYESSHQIQKVYGLIRSRTDHGTVVCLEPRIVTRRCGQRFVGRYPTAVESKRLFLH
jgi:hypothetical protein